MEKGVEMAKIQLSAIVKQVQSFLDANLVISAGPFLYAFVQEVKLFMNIHWIHYQQISSFICCIIILNE